MESKLVIYNTLTRQKERFEPLHAPNVGMYVCGPTVYGDPHLGHARPAITFDLVFRYLKHLGYKVRYVRTGAVGAHGDCTVLYQSLSPVYGCAECIASFY